MKGDTLCRSFKTASVSQSKMWKNVDTTKCLTLELLLWASVAGWLEWILKMPGIPLQNVIAGTCKSECARYCRSLRKDRANYKKGLSQKETYFDFRLQSPCISSISLKIHYTNIPSFWQTSHITFGTQNIIFEFFSKKVHFFVRFRRHNRLYYIRL